MRRAIRRGEIIISSLSSSGKASLSWLTWTALVAALSDFLSTAVAQLPRHRCPLTHPRSPLPSAIAGLGAAAPRAPRVPLAVGCNRIINHKKNHMVMHPWSCYCVCEANNECWTLKIHWYVLCPCNKHTQMCIRPQTAHVPPTALE